MAIPAFVMVGGALFAFGLVVWSLYRDHVSKIREWEESFMDIPEDE